MLPGRICPTSNCFTSSSESLTRGVPGSATYLPSAPRARSGFNQRSWEITSTPSRVTPISSSSVLTPIESALANDASVFSGNSARPPRWASISNAETFTSVMPACSPPMAFGALKAAATSTAKHPRTCRRVINNTILPRTECRLPEQHLLRSRLRAPILRRGVHFATELGRSVPRPARIVEHAAGERDHIGLAGSDDFFGVAGFGDQADGHRGHAGGLLDRLRKRQLIAGRQWNFLQWRYPAGGDVDPVDAAFFQLLGKLDGLFEVPAALDPVGRRDLDADRLFRRKHRAHRIEHFERIPHPVLQRSAIFVGALVGDRRQELVQQIAVRAMQLNGVDTQPAGAPRGFDEGLANPLEPHDIEYERLQLAILVRDLRRPHRLPSSLGERYLLPPLPRLVTRSLAARMGQLNRNRDRRMPAPRSENRPQRRFGGVVPQTETSRRDAADGLDMGRLHAEHRRARQSKVIDVGKMPVVRLAAFRRVLAHRRDHDAVWKCKVTQTDRRKQGAHKTVSAIGNNRLQRSIIHSDDGRRMSNA